MTCLRSLAQQRLDGRHVYSRLRYSGLPEPLFLGELKVRFGYIRFQPSYATKPVAHSLGIEPIRTQITSMGRCYIYTDRKSVV